ALLGGCEAKPRSLDGAVTGDGGGVLVDGALADGGASLDGGPTAPTSPLVDPTCTDGMFSETLPNASADISDLIAGYSPAGAASFVTATLARRYPTGEDLVTAGD